MTFHIEPWVGKILSPVVLLYPDGKRQEFRDGKELMQTIFPEPYTIEEIRVVKNMIELALKQPPPPDTTFF